MFESIEETFLSPILSYSIFPHPMEPPLQQIHPVPSYVSIIKHTNEKSEDLSASIYAK